MFVGRGSRVFDAAFNSNFVEGKIQEDRLQHTSPGAFQFQVQWLYTKNFDVSQLDNNLARGLPNDGSKVLTQGLMQEDMHLAELWLLAEKLLIPEMQNLVIKTIIQVIDETDQIPTERF